MNKRLPQLIDAGSFKDERGMIVFCNEFNMEAVKRMYIIAPISPDTIRAWQAHQSEEKWFFCLNGAFEIKLVAVDNFEAPGPASELLTYTLKASEPQILHIPGGYANGFKAIAENSRLMVYSNYNLADSRSDDLRYPLNQWEGWR